MCVRLRLLRMFCCQTRPILNFQLRQRGSDCVMAMFLLFLSGSMKLRAPMWAQSGITFIVSLLRQGLWQLSTVILVSSGMESLGLTVSIIILLSKSQIKQRMFNPKEALERIRRSKNQKQEVKLISQGVQPLFANNEKVDPGPNIEDRVNKLEMMLSRLQEELTNSNEVVGKLRKQNSNLETQILKLEYENSQLKSSHAQSSIRLSSSNKKYSEPIPEQPQRVREQRKVRKTQSHLTFSQNEHLSPEVEQIVQDIKNEPIESVLRRKQYQYKARKPEPKLLAAGNKYLQDLAQIEKDYSRTMRKPVLIIKLDDADFE